MSCLRILKLSAQYRVILPLLACLALGMVEFSSSAFAEQEPDKASVTRDLVRVRNLTEQIERVHSGQITPLPWHELQSFQLLVWRSMAFDPDRGGIQELDKRFRATGLTAELKVELQRLMESPWIEDLKVQSSAEAYAQIINQFIEFRQSLRYNTARALARQGQIEDAYKTLEAAVYQGSQQNQSYRKLIDTEFQRRYLELQDAVSRVRSNYSPLASSQSEPEGRTLEESLAMTRPIQTEVQMPTEVIATTPIKEVPVIETKRKNLSDSSSIPAPLPSYLDWLIVSLMVIVLIFILKSLLGSTRNAQEPEKKSIVHPLKANPIEVAVSNHSPFTFQGFQNELLGCLNDETLLTRIMHPVLTSNLKSDQQQAALDLLSEMIDEWQQDIKTSQTLDELSSRLDQRLEHLSQAVSTQLVQGDERMIMSLLEKSMVLLLTEFASHFPEQAQAA